MTRRPSDDELMSAARRLRQLLDAYVRSPAYRGPGTATGDAVEPLLRHYVREYAPELQRRSDELQEYMASAAWQLLIRRPRGRALDRAIDVIARRRRRYDATDRWPANRGKLIDAVRALMEPPSGRGRPLTDIARANRIYELLAVGYVGRDSRGGVRGAREELLLEAKLHAEDIVTSKR